MPCRYPCATSACAERCALPLAHQSARQQRSPPHTAAGPPPPTAAQPSGAAASPAAEKAVRAGSAPGCGFKLGTMRRSIALWYLRGALAGWWGGEARLRRGEERRAHVRLVRLACRKVQRGFREGSERVQRGPREGPERVQRGFREGSERGPKKGRCALLTPLASKEVEGPVRRVADNALPVAVSRRARRAHAAPASSRVHPRVAVARAPAAGRLAH